MEHYETYLILFMAGIIIGAFSSLTMGTGFQRRTDWEYTSPNLHNAYASSRRNASSFWTTVLIGLILLVLALLWAGQMEAYPSTRPVTEVLEMIPN